MKTSNFISNMNNWCFEDSFEVLHVSLAQKLTNPKFSPMIFFFLPLVSSATSQSDRWQREKNHKRKFEIRRFLSYRGMQHLKRILRTSVIQIWNKIVTFNYENFEKKMIFPKFASKFLKVFGKLGLISGQPFKIYSKWLYYLWVNIILGKVKSFETSRWFLWKMASFSWR